MTQHSDDKSPSNKVLLQTVFEEHARHLGLELEGGDSGNRMVGVAFVPAAHQSQSGLAQEVPKQLDESDQQQIQEIVESWETMHPDDFDKNWRNVTTEPFIAIGPGWIKTADQAFVDGWLASKGLQKLVDDWRPFNPRKTEVSNVQIVFVGESLASVTYSTKEETGKNPTVGNAAAILMKTPAGWRIAAITRYDRVV
ncbi:MAG: hypothetical protein KDD47_05990 [Acidobacteria bacterium]|nr:hypothetical protein [Acidobacteriota bacterium]